MIARARPYWLVNNYYKQLYSPLYLPLNRLVNAMRNFSRVLWAWKLSELWLVTRLLCSAGAYKQTNITPLKQWMTTVSAQRILGKDGVSIATDRRALQSFFWRKFNLSRTLINVTYHFVSIALSINVWCLASEEQTCRFAFGRTEIIADRCWWRNIIFIMSTSRRRCLIYVPSPSRRP